MWFIITISGLSILGWFVNTYPPNSFLRIAIFFLLIGATTFFTSLYLLKIVRRAALLTLGVVIWLLLRFLDLRDWYYPALLLPILISLDILLR